MAPTDGPISGPIVRDIAYSVRRAGADVELVITVDMISFRREVIPDGELAGQIGHREVPHEREDRHTLHPMVARQLWEDLGRALGVPDARGLFIRDAEMVAREELDRLRRKAGEGPAVYHGVTVPAELAGALTWLSAARNVAELWATLDEQTVPCAARAAWPQLGQLLDRLVAAAGPATSATIPAGTWDDPGAGDPEWGTR